MLNFYASAFSPFATKVHYLLEEAGIPYKYHQVNLRDDKGRELINSVNPFGKVPAIEVNGFSLGESNAILRYVADRFALHSLYPVNLEERAHVDMTLEFAHNHVNRWLMSLAWNLAMAPRMGMTPDLKAVEEARTQLPLSLARFERAIAGKPNLCGPELTIADIAVVPFAAQHKLAEVSFSDYPHLAAWTARMVDRPAWKKTHAEVDKRVGELLAHR